MLGVFDRDEFEQLASYLERFVGALDEFVADVGDNTKKN
jgi:methyl-accepting chemotaxis protein